MALIFGFIVALFAVISKMMHNYAERKKLMNSVQPVLIIETIKAESLFIKTILKNTGSGSAILDNVDVLIDNKLLPWNKRSLNSSLERLGLNGMDVLFGVPTAGEKIAINETYYLFEANPVSKNEFDRIESALKRFSLRIKYKSIYGETFILE